MLRCTLIAGPLRAALLSGIKRSNYIAAKATAGKRTRKREIAMSQAVRTPAGIAIRAVAAASLYSSKATRTEGEKAAASKNNEVTPIDLARAPDRENRAEPKR